MSSSSSSAPPSCRIDRDILNEHSIKDMDDIALSFFASACGKNRGAFVLDPPDGQTYGCLQLPQNVTDLAGLDIPDGVVDVPDANSIKNNYVEGNLTGYETIALLDFLVDRVYESTPSKEGNPYSCDVNGLAKLSCGHKKKSPRPDGEPIRAVTLNGMLTPDKLSGETIHYTPNDFKEMADLGLNTAHIVVPTSAFTSGDMEGVALEAVLSVALAKIEKIPGFTSILTLTATGDELDAVVKAASYASKLGPGVVTALTIPKGMLVDNKTVIDSIRATVGPDLPLMIPLAEGDLIGKASALSNIDDPNVFGSLEWHHTTTVGDVASSTSQEDRSKMFYHESVACIMRSPFEHADCYQNTPLFWSSGFDLSIDDCVLKEGNDPLFKDYGQCDRFEETIGSGWWERHRSSFAARQLYASEQGLGWSFTSWKLSDKDAGVGVIDSPAKLSSFRDVSRAGLFPDLTSASTKTTRLAETACLNPPDNDFVLGDDTLAPTMGPPPDCGNGWWNYTTSKCDYWIPPPEPTPAPTEPCPSCPVCSDETASTTLVQKNAMGTTRAAAAGASEMMPLILAGLCGAVLAALFGYAREKRAKKRAEYSPIPTTAN